MAETLTPAQRMRDQIDRCRCARRPYSATTLVVVCSRCWSALAKLAALGAPTRKGEEGEHG